MDINIPRGTYDLYGRELRLRNKIIDDVKLIMESYLFEMIETPVFEQKALFSRTNDGDTDIVNKEMYEFLDKKGREMALRPELTAPVARAYVSNKMFTDAKTKLFYYMPAFRYERPQAGRYRQFYQLGVESYGEKIATTDVEVISLVCAILRHFEILDDVVLKINSIGNPISRKAYNLELVKYYEAHEEILCDDCKRRLQSNPLRLLDCKVCSDKKEIQNPPLISDFLDKDSSNYFKEVLNLLDLLEIEYEVDEKLVRGLDYYNDTVFEVVSKIDGLTVCGGGRYDTLLNQISRHSSPAFGFGMGVERLTSLLIAKKTDLLESFNPEADIIYVPLTQDAYNICYKSMIKLRDYGLRCYLSDHVRSLKNSLKYASKLNCVYAVIIGEDELQSELVTIKNLVNREEEKISLLEFEADLISSGEESNEH